MSKRAAPTPAIAQLEQTAVEMENQAEIVASYYNRMVLRGIPPELAAELAKVWHAMYWGVHFDLQLKRDEDYEQ